MIDIPPLPPDAPRTTAPVPLRFEDVTRDGRIVLESLPNAFTATVWRRILKGSETARAFRSQGIVPILARLRMEGTPGPFSANAQVEADGTYRLVRAEDGRFLVEMWAELHAPIGRTYGKTERQGERSRVGRVYAEHVLTRPFAADGDRRVRSLDFPGAPVAEHTRAALPAFESIASIPEHATPLEPAGRVDPTPTAFGIMHTDSNMHVNSLVYLRVFEEAALRRFVAIGRGSSLLARTVDIAYRKPCFAGQTMRIVLQAFEAGARLGVAATIVTEPDAKDENLARAKPHAYVRMGFES
ncbi:MAG: hypothetical protein M3O46_00920 [Myxococcota bacterium]|nr:hypothetical protein [Myxococcota bacterium]